MVVLNITSAFSKEMVAYVKKLQKPSTQESAQRKEAHKKIFQAIEERSLLEKIKQHKRKAYIVKKGSVVKYDIKTLKHEKKSILGLVTGGVSEGAWPSFNGEELMPVLQFSKDDLPNFADVFGNDVELAGFYSPPNAAHKKVGFKPDIWFEPYSQQLD